MEGAQGVVQVQQAAAFSASFNMSSAFTGRGGYVRCFSMGRNAKAPAEGQGF
jgi:hypothetical protein